MSIKIKVTLGVLFLFAVILVISGLGLYYLQRLSQDSKNILTDNYETLQYTKEIISQCDRLKTDSADALEIMEKNIRLQESNITEAGEGELTRSLRSVLNRIKVSHVDDVLLAELRNTCLSIQQINMEAIQKKNENAQQTSENASTYLVITGTLCVLAAFVFIINFPGYIGDPIAQLTSGIKAIANKNYEERLQFDRNDEFEELANAFNLMAEKLDTYEHSNLAKIIFEKKRIETIINRMTDPVIGLDEGNRIIFVNDEALHLLHLERTSVIDQYAPDIAIHNDLLRSLIKTSDPGKNESGLIKAVVSGKENYFSKEIIHVNYLPTGEKENINIGAVILLKNVTAYKELDLAKTNFIATISHELKTPIASLQMCVKLLQDSRVGTLNEEQANIAETLQDEVSRISKITNELLDLSQVETGNIKLNIKRADSYDIVSLATEAVKFQAERKHIIIDIEIEKDVPAVQADIDKTTWVLVNFLTNAIRYSAENGHVVVKCEADNRFVTFSVSDNGPGIEAKYLDRIFEKFFQIPGTASGTGLGLAISKEFIEAQGGKISAESVPGRGTTFTFQLPEGV
ncbi:sensor histidine kinase [Chryseosolibacter indicus]|uniref:histidine kinase n=1 Tax=Chryseosolibacter indicus TaxID=2782351 RepID=A0ABS5VWZ3_9BACT|nr:ATP-binding protein [Chryseosolibacter indicus]MBT1705943.1 cell wall metabolism sensor histidine kinase WalK [Chryseosolibacter indicus]